MKQKRTLAGIDLVYTVEGEGSPVILMHGWGCDHNTVASIAQLLTPHFRVYNLDMPGSGESSEPEAVWGVEDYARMLQAFVAAEGIDRPILIGHSNGGRVALQYATENPVHKMILVGSAGIKPKRPLKYYVKVYSYKVVKRLALLLLGQEGGNRFLEGYRKQAGSSDYAKSSPKMRQIMVRLVNTDLQAVMPKINCPTLLIFGQNDTATPVADGKRMEQLIPNAGLVVIPDADHYCFLPYPHGNPQMFAAVVNSFLDKDKR